MSGCKFTKKASWPDYPTLDSARRLLAKRCRRWIQLVALWRNVPAVGFSSSPFGETLSPLDLARRPLAKRSRRWIGSSPFGETLPPLDSALPTSLTMCRRWIPVGHRGANNSIIYNYG